MKISVIIPILNEAATIGQLLSYLATVSSKELVEEIIIVDGGSTDRSKMIVEQYALKNTITVKLITSEKGRAKQLNAGAFVANSNILYFLHADSFPPQQFDKSIIQEVQKGNPAGCFRMRFDSNHWWLRFLSWMTQFKSKKCRGGDQSQFITKALFEDINGYDESYVVYEDNELVDRLFDRNQFVIIPRYVISSARKYREIGVWRLQYHFLNIHMRRWLGASSEDLYRYYKEKVVS